MKANSEKVFLNICVLTVSDTRTADTDSSGDYLCKSLGEEGHYLRFRAIVRDDIYQIRAKLSEWIADLETHAILVTGGTGFSGRDSTPEAVKVLFDKEVEGFGETFRHFSLKEIGSSTIQSRALAGLANNTIIFCMPGSNNACETAWVKIIRDQLDSTFKPCNFVGHVLKKNQ